MLAPLWRRDIFFHPLTSRLSTSSQIHDRTREPAEESAQKTRASLPKQKCDDYWLRVRTGGNATGSVRTTSPPVSAPTYGCTW